MPIAVNAPDCRHCGTPVPQGRTDDFCCGGCAYVHDLLQQQGLEQFYQLRGTQLLSPVSPQALRERDYGWLRKRIHEAEERSTGSTAETDFSIQGLSCVGCVWLIERLFQRFEGGLQIRVDVVHGTLKIEWEKGRFDAERFAIELQNFGYLIGSPSSKQTSGTAHLLQKRLGACGAFAMNAMAFSLPRYFGMPADFAFANWFEMVAAASATLALIVGGSYFVERAWRSLQARTLHLDTPIALGILVAYLASLFGWVLGAEELKYFDFVAIFVFLMLAGRWMQQQAVDRNRRRLMQDSSVTTEVVLGDGDLCPVEELAPEAVFQVRPEQSIPVASRLIDADATLSLEWINGETEASSRKAGDRLPAGAMNIGTQAIHVEALEAWADSSLRRLLEARRREPQRDLGLEALLRGYLFVVILLGIGGAVAWLAVGAGWIQAMQVMVSVFVISCPCAIGVAIPLAEEMATTHAERAGVFVRQLGLWKRLHRLRRIVFDKTGTLTLENPRLVDPEGLSLLPERARSALRTLVRSNLHPVSRSLFDALGPDRDPENAVTGTVEEEIGIGLTLHEADGDEWSLQRPEAPSDHGADAVFRHNGRTLAGFQFRDQLRQSSKEEVAELRRRQLAVHILSGDREEKVAHLADQLDLSHDHWSAGLSPDEKAAWVRNHSPETTLFIGDGANDSLAFDEALCTGSPMGGRSFLEQKADFFFLGHSLTFVSTLLDLARRQRRAVHRVFGFSVCYNVAAVIFCLSGRIDPLLASILMPLSSLCTLALVALTFRGSGGRTRTTG